MANFFQQPQNVRTFVIEPLVALRSQLLDHVRDLAFEAATGYSDLKSFLDILEVEPVDWILTASFSNTEVNVFHLLQICSEEPSFKNIRISLLYRDGEEDLLPLAFEMGLFSAHNTSIPSKVSEDIQGLMRNLRSASYNSTLVSAFYIRRMLREKRHWEHIIKFEKTILELFPGSTECLMSLAQAQLSAGLEDGVLTLQQIKLLKPSLSEQVDELAMQYVSPDASDNLLELQDANAGVKPTLNALGIDCAVLIDPDSAVQHAIRQALSGAGIKDIEVFDSGESAWDWIHHGGRCSLILMEWRIPDMSGVQLIQRIRQQFASVPIMVVSSLVSQAEMPLVKEMGVNAIVEKPFDTPTLIAELITVIQQNRYPTEQTSMDHKIVNCLEAGNKAEASRLLAMYLSNPSYDDIGKKRIQAEFAFHEGHYRQSCTLASAALKQSSNSLELLNLLGKALMKLGDFETALKCMEKAHSLSPRNIDRICKMSMLCADLGRVDDANAHLDQAKDIDSKNILVLESESQLALQQKDTARAMHALAKLESLQRIAAFINNKAVALVRNNQFQDGIALYNSALEALPPPWGYVHDTVCYNLALAHIRFHEYTQATEALKKVKSGPETAIGKKASSLMHRLAQAESTKTPFMITPEKVPEPASTAAGPAESGIDFAALVEGLAASRGDICCYRIYAADSLVTREGLNLLKHTPRIKKRAAIKRDEALQVKSGTRNSA
jgi:CheY-like chemotaxis protein